MDLPPIDREKVIRGLRCCTEISGSCIGSDICPYFKCRGCLNALMKDALELLQDQPQWHPFNPLEPDDTGLKDHYFYLVTVKGFKTPMKAKYHDDLPFGFQPPLTRDFDPCDVIAWRELPDNMNEGDYNDARGLFKDKGSGNTDSDEEQDK